MGGSLMQMLQQYGQQFQGGGGGNLGGALGLPNGAPMQLRGGGGGYAQPMRRYDPDFGDPRRAQGTGGGAVSAPDGSVSYAGGATSPFEVGGDSGRPVSAGNGYGAGQLPGGANFDPYDPRNGLSHIPWQTTMPVQFGGGQGAGGGDQRRAYWDRGMNDNGGAGGRRPLGPESQGGGGYWQRPRPMGGQMGPRGPMPGQGVPLGSGGHEMPNPGGAPTTQGGMIKSANPGQSQVYNPQGGGPVSLTPAQPQQQVRRVTRDDPQARGWSGYA